jgi:hypothetical protein
MREKITETVLTCDFCLDEVDNFAIAGSLPSDQQIVVKEIKLDVYYVGTKSLDACGICSEIIIDLLRKNFPDSKFLE